MEREKMISLIKNKNKTTLVKAYIQAKEDIVFKGVKQFGDKSLYLVIGDFNIIKKTKYGSDGIGGIITNGTMYVGYPR